MKNVHKYYILFLGLLSMTIFSPSNAAVYYTIAAGVWQTGEIWSTTEDGTEGMVWGTFPVEDGDIFYINHDVSVSEENSVMLKIDEDITIIIKEGSTLMVIGKLQLGAGSVIIIPEGAHIDSPDPNCPQVPGQPISNNEKIWIGEEVVWTSKDCELTGTILPVVLNDFQITKQKTSFLLNWSTISEQNFDYFSVERSYDAKNYLSIGTVKGSGWSQTRKEYEFTDINPLPGINYYRLKAVDFDGSVEYFPPVSIYNDNTQVSIASPIKDKTISIHSNIQAKAQLVNLFGASIIAEYISSGPNQLALPVWLPKGVYVLVITNDKLLVKKEKVFVE